MEGIVKKVAGPLVVAENMKNSNMFDVVHVGEQELIGEIIEIHSGNAYIQIYEETSGLGPGAPVKSSNRPLSVELGPGLIGSIFDGIQRPLSLIMEKTGNSLKRGVSVPSLNRDKLWHFIPHVKIEDEVSGGDILGTVKENESINHKIMVPPGVSGRIVSICREGDYKIDETIVKISFNENDEIKEESLSLMQYWPVRKPRPIKEKLIPKEPLISGQRVIDALFPLAKGGVASVPGPFGSGKTVVQHQLAKWADADVIVYIGCGERGNEMTDVLNEFPELIDPKTGRSLMERTVLIANTSDMPVAAREASIYTGITIAEYFRDMGLNVALMADSTSRWAEALREMSGRLGEMPGEEGYPAYLASRLAQFYERAGRVVPFGKDKNEGTLSIIGAVSPPGGDLSEPVTQATLRIIKTFWGLDSSLAYSRHFPAINWLTSYSLYVNNLEDWFKSNIASDWCEIRSEVIKILSKEAELQEIVKLVGADSLAFKDRLLLEIARSIREDFLHQNAFHKTDTFSSLKKQYLLLKLILKFYSDVSRLENTQTNIDDIVKFKSLEKIGRFKYVDEQNIEDEYRKIDEEINKEVSDILGDNVNEDKLAS